jgi:hypothetical protein
MQVRYLKMKFIAYDSQKWRVERLQKTVRLATAILGMGEDHMSALVAKVEDQRGNLITYWYTAPSTHQKNAFRTAWAECERRGWENQIEKAPKISFYVQQSAGAWHRHGEPVSVAKEISGENWI